jgi:hypothetical protein
MQQPQLRVSGASEADAVNNAISSMAPHVHAAKTHHSTDEHPQPLRSDQQHNQQMEQLQGCALMQQEVPEADTGASTGTFAGGCQQQPQDEQVQGVVISDAVRVACAGHPGLLQLQQHRE